MIERRTFLKSAMLASALAAGADVAPGKNKIRCGILGIDHSHGLDVLQVLQKSPDFELVGVCEPDDALRQKFFAMPELKGVRSLSMDELLKDDSIKMTAIESAVPRLLEFARKAVDAGKHVHMDKPAGASFAEYEASRNAAEQKSLLFQMGYMFRYNPGFDLVRRAVKEGMLGDIYSISGSICTDIDAAKRERMAKYSGGMTFELGSHLIDMIVIILGAPSKVTPYLRHDGPQQDKLADNTLAVLEYPHALVTVESAAMEFGAFETRRFKICGTNGSIVLNPLEPPKGVLSLRKATGEFKQGEQTIAFDDPGRHVRDFADFAACIRGERKFAYSKEHDLLVQKTLLQASGMQVS